MRRVYLFSAIVALTLTSCTQSVDPESVKLCKDEAVLNHTKREIVTQYHKLIIPALWKGKVKFLEIVEARKVNENEYYCRGLFFGDIGNEGKKLLVGYSVEFYPEGEGKPKIVKLVSVEEVK